MIKPYMDPKIIENKILANVEKNRARRGTILKFLGIAALLTAASAGVYQAGQWIDERSRSAAIGSAGIPHYIVTPDYVATTCSHEELTEIQDLVNRALGTEVQIYNGSSISDSVDQ